MKTIMAFIIGYIAAVFIYTAILIILLLSLYWICYVTIAFMCRQWSKAQNRRVPSADSAVGLQERTVVAAGGDLRLEEGSKDPFFKPQFELPKEEAPSPNAVPRPAHSQAAAAFFRQTDVERIDAPNLRWYIVRAGVAYEVSEFDAWRLRAHDPEERVMHITEKDAMSFFSVSKMMLND